MQQSETSKSKSIPVTDEELGAQQYLFEAAYNDIKFGKQSRKKRIQTLAKELEDIGYQTNRIARAIIKKFTEGQLKCTTDDYIRRVLDKKFKDYTQWGETEVETIKEKEKKTAKVIEKTSVKDDDLEVEKTKEDGKEITTVYLKKPAKTQEQVEKVKDALIPPIELESESEVELPIRTPDVGKERYTQLEAKARILEEENQSLRQEKEENFKAMDTKINELLAEIRELEKPFQQRQYIKTKAGGETVIIGYYCVAMPGTKNMGVVKGSATPLATVAEKEQDFAEWQKSLKPGRESIDVNMDFKSKASSKSPESK